MNVFNLFSMKGRVAVVTGGARNLGRSMAEGLAEAGAVVHITSRDAATAQRAAKELAQVTKAEVHGHGLDILSEQSLAALVSEILKKSGSIDVLVNNAGGHQTDPVLGPKYAMNKPEEQPLEDWSKTLEVNLTSVFLVTKYVVPTMKKQKSGSIINISSFSAILGRDRWVYEGSPDMQPCVSSYTAAKAGVIGFTRDTAAQLGQFGIRVNAILPGGFERGQPKEFIKRYSSHTMLGRMGDDDLDLKGAILYLASDASRYVTSHSLVVDGGMVHFR